MNTNNPQPHPLQPLFNEQRIKGPLHGTVVLDFSRHVPGPVTSTLLRNLGALIIRIEPKHGDPYRHSITKGVLDPKQLLNGTLTAETLYNILNSDKIHILMLNLDIPEEMILLQRLLSISSVLLESFRPSIIYKILRTTPAQIKEKYPQLIIVSITLGGQHSKAAGHDIGFQSTSGLISWVTPFHLPVLTTKQIPLIQPFATLLSYDKKSISNPYQLITPQLYLQQHQQLQPLPPQTTTQPQYPTLTTLQSIYPVPIHQLSLPLRLPSVPSALVADCTSSLVALSSILAQLVPTNNINTNTTQSTTTTSSNITQSTLTTSSNQSSTQSKTKSQFLDVALSAHPLIHSPLLTGLYSSHADNHFLFYELSGHYAHYTIYQTKDGYISVATVEPQFWSNLLQVTGINTKYHISLLPRAVISTTNALYTIIQTSINNTIDGQFNPNALSTLPPLLQQHALFLLYNEYCCKVLQYELIQKTTQEWFQIFTNFNLRNDSCCEPILSVVEAEQLFIDNTKIAAQSPSSTAAVYTDMSTLLPLHPVHMKHVVPHITIGQDSKRISELMMNAKL